jgi:hypothetical protein
MRIGLTAWTASSSPAKATLIRLATTKAYFIVSLKIYRGNGVGEQKLWSKIEVKSAIPFTILATVNRLYLYQGDAKNVREPPQGIHVEINNAAHAMAA